MLKSKLIGALKILEAQNNAFFLSQQAEYHLLLLEN